MYQILNMKGVEKPLWMNVNVPQLFHMILVTTQEFILKLFRPKNPTWFLCLDQLCIMTSRDRILLISPNIKRYQIKPECELYKRIYCYWRVIGQYWCHKDTSLSLWRHFSIKSLTASLWKQTYNPFARNSLIIIDGSHLF